MFDRVSKVAEAKQLAASAPDGVLEGPERPLAITDGNLVGDHNNALVATTEKTSTGGVEHVNGNTSLVAASGARTGIAGSNVQLIPKKAPTIPKPTWHAPWKLSRVISGKYPKSESINNKF